MRPRQARRRPGYVIATAVLGIIVVLAVVVTIVNQGGSGSTVTSSPTPHAAQDTSTTPTAPTPTTPATSSTHPTVSASSSAARDSSPGADGTGGSICGLSAGKPLVGKLEPPEAEWKYDGPTGYPTSPRYGPGRTADAGFRYCYQHSATGALFAAAGAIAFNNRSEAVSQAWSRYSLADGPYRDQLLHGSYQPDDPSVRTKIIGYRLLSYDAEEAKIDLAVRLSSTEQTLLTSVLMDLVWQHGDWRFSTQTPDSVQATRLVDLAGYTSWSDD